MVFGTYSADKLLPVVKVIKYKEKGYGALLAVNGIYLVHPTRPDLNGKMNLLTGAVDEEVKKKLPPNSTIDPQLMNGFKKVAETNERLRLSYKATNGASQVGSLNIISLPGGQRWVLLLQLPHWISLAKPLLFQLLLPPLFHPLPLPLPQPFWE